MVSPSPQTPVTDVGRLLELAVTLANRAGRAITEMRPNAIKSAQTKSSPTDPVTEADAAAEQIIMDGILAERPDDGIVGEEGANRQGSSGVEWFVDPIDGTTNYLYGIPAYSVSIAASVGGEPTVGVVLNPVTVELFTATAKGGAFLNGRAITVSGKEELATSLIATGFSYRHEQRAMQARLLNSVLPQVRDIRRFGSAALDLCSVAAGRVDGYYEAGLNIWDYAAGSLIVREAGGRCSLVPHNEDGSEWLIAGPSSIARPLERIIMDPLT